MRIKTVTVALSVAVFAAACTTDPYTGEQKVSNTAGGAAIGAGLGALAGMALGGGSDRRNALIGAGVGALAGGAIGNFMDRQEAELRAQLEGTGVSVTRMGDRIVLNMPSDVTFRTDEDSVQSSFYPVLNSVAIVLRKYNRTLVDVNGHTDSSGSDEYNDRLSQRRALSVADYIASQGVDPRRFAVNGYGESDPIATNDTPAGRATNRRVEIYLVPLT